MTQTFIDTIIVVSCTGLVIISTGTWNKIDSETGEQIGAALMTAEAFSYGLPGDWWEAGKAEEAGTAAPQPQSQRQRKT